MFGKDFWKFLMYSDPSAYLLGQWGMLGNEAKSASEELKPLYEILAVIVFVVAVVIGIVALISKIFQG